MPTVGCFFSDHMPVFCELDMGKVPSTQSKVSYLNLSAINLDALQADFSDSSLCKNTDLFDVNELAICYNETFESAISRHAPMKTKRILALDHMYLSLTLKLICKKREKSRTKMEN